MTDTTSDYPESFRFTDEGDSITGTVARYSTGMAKFGETPIMVIATDAGERSVWIWGTVLKEKVGRLAPKPGEAIRITFVGTKTSNASGNEYKVFNVECPDREPELPPFAEWAADSSYPNDEPPAEEPSPWG